MTLQARSALGLKSGEREEPNRRLTQPCLPQKHPHSNVSGRVWSVPLDLLLSLCTPLVLLGWMSAEALVIASWTLLTRSHGPPTVAAGECQAQWAQTTITSPRHGEHVEQRSKSSAGDQPERSERKEHRWDATAEWVIEAQARWMFVSRLKYSSSNDHH